MHFIATLILMLMPSAGRADNCPHPETRPIGASAMEQLKLSDQVAARINADSMSTDEIIDAYVERAVKDRETAMDSTQYVKFTVKHDGKSASGTAIRTLHADGSISWSKPEWLTPDPHWASFPISTFIGHDNGAATPDFNRENYVFTLKSKIKGQDGAIKAFVFSITPTPAALAKFDHGQLVVEDLTIDAKTFEKIGDAGHPLKDPSPVVQDTRFDRTFRIVDGRRTDDHLSSTFTADLSKLSLIKRKVASAADGAGPYELDFDYDKQ